MKRCAGSEKSSCCHAGFLLKSVNESASADFKNGKIWRQSACQINDIAAGAVWLAALQVKWE